MHDSIIVFTSFEYLEIKWHDIFRTMLCLLISYTYVVKSG